MSKSTPPRGLNESSGSAVGLIRQVRLIWRLWKDGRVPGWVKLLPVAGLAYLLSPIDLIPDVMLPGIGEIDDVVLLFLALKAFVDLSPPGVVREHLDRLVGNRRSFRPSEPESSFIDAPYRVLDPDERPDEWRTKE